MQLILILASCTVVFAAGLDAAVDCAHADGPAEQAICAKPQLRALNQEVDRLTANLKLTGENAEILADTQMPFVRQRNDCANHDPEIEACVQKVLAQRVELLRHAAVDPNAIREAIRQANFVDIGFVWRYWPELLGRKVSVFGCIALEDNAPRTHATLETENQPPVPVLFKSMPEGTAEFLDDQKPCSHWGVTVRKNGAKFVLFADDVLGNPLP